MLSAMGGLEGVDVYIDDLLIYPATLQAYNRSLKQVLARSMIGAQCDSRGRIRWGKNFFSRAWASKKGIRASHSKVEAVQFITDQCLHTSLPKFSINIHEYLSVTGSMQKELPV